MRNMIMPATMGLGLAITAGAVGRYGQVKVIVYPPPPATPLLVC
jgi:hypothetical protein